MTRLASKARVRQWAFPVDFELSEDRNGETETARVLLCAPCEDRGLQVLGFPLDGVADAVTRRAMGPCDGCGSPALFRVLLGAVEGAS